MSAVATHRTRVPLRILAGLCQASLLLVISLFIFFIGGILLRGLPEVTPSFLFENPARAGREGGIFSILLTTGLIVSIALLCAAPISLGAALFLRMFTSSDSPSSRRVRISLDLLSSTPSIVFGLFGSAFFCSVLNFGFSILSGGLTLACMILPLLIRMTDEGLRAVPETYRVNAHALGLSKTSVFLSVLLPLAFPRLVAACIIGLGRALAETAALLFTSGYIMRTPSSLFDSGRTLSVHIFDLSMNVPGGDSRAYGAAVILVLVLLSLSSIATYTADIWTKRMHLK